MRPLDPLRSIKAKLGVVIVAAVAVTVVVVAAGIRFGLPLWLVSAGAAALALIMVQLLARGMTSPLREMAAAARAMAKGDHDRRVTASSKDEVGELARAFNTMAADLAETERIRRDLIANVSHDLRTPIGALQAVLENLIDGVVSADRATLETMLGQVHRLGHLVAQLLDLSRLEAGTVTLDPEDLEMAGLLGEIVPPFRLRYPDMRVTVQVSPAGLRVHADRERLHQVIANLLENALRLSPPGAGVAVSARANERVVVLAFEDEGPGVPPGEETKIFERFYRSDGARSTDEGAGLGLAIARWIVDLHGGEIRVERRVPRGSRFVVELEAAS